MTYTSPLRNSKMLKQCPPDMRREILLLARYEEEHAARVEEQARKADEFRRLVVRAVEEVLEAGSFTRIEIRQLTGLTSDQVRDALNVLPVCKTKDVIPKFSLMQPING